MKWDTRDPWMAGATWAIAVVVAIAVGRLDIPAALIASFDRAAPQAPSIEAVLPSTVGDHRGAEPRREPDDADADRAPLADAVPLRHLPPGSEYREPVSRADGLLAEQDPWPASTARPPILDVGSARDDDAETRVAEEVPTPKPAEPGAKSDPNLDPRPDPKPAEPEAKPDPKPARPKPDAKPDLKPDSRSKPDTKAAGAKADQPTDGAQESPATD